MPEGIDAPAPPPEDDGEGMLGELRPPPPPEEPLEPEEPPLELGELGEGMEVDDCWLAQPPIRNADTVLTAASCAAITSHRFHG